MRGPETTQTAGFTAADFTGVLVVTLDRPPANALNRSAIRNLAALFADLTEMREAPPSSSQARENDSSAPEAI